jgi:hypothetical protein
LISINFSYNLSIGMLHAFVYQMVNIGNPSPSMTKKIFEMN